MKKNKRTFLAKRVLLSALLAVTMAFSFVGETGAYLVSSGNPVDNAFSGSYVDVTINGSGGPETAYITNTGNTTAYVRAVVTVNWVNEDTGNWYVDGAWTDTRQYLARAPVKGAAGETYTNDDGSTSTVDYTYVVRSADWLEVTITETVGSGSVSYTALYYRKPLKPGESTSTMLSSFTYHNGVKSITKTFQNGKALVYALTADFTVDAIQCETVGVTAVSNCAVVQEWGVTLSGIGGNITAAPATDYIPYLVSN